MNDGLGGAVMSFSNMTSKERLLTAIQGGMPDRVPCTPDFSNMIPCRLTGRPFWEIYLEGNAALYRAYAKAVEYFGIDGWFTSGSAMTFQRKREGDARVTRSVGEPKNGRIAVRTTYEMTEGSLTEETALRVADSPAATEKLIKDLERDFPLYKKLRGGDIVSCKTPFLEEQRALCGDRGIFCLQVGYPGIQTFCGLMDGGVADAVYACYDHGDIMDEWAELIDRDSARMAEMMLDHRPDVLLLGGSGTLTLANPQLVRRYALPTIKKLTRMCREAGIPSMLHSCGKSMAFLKMLYEETDLNCINPLEPSPMGDADLAEVKKLYGDKLCLMGNLNTTKMLFMTAEEAAKASRDAIDAAGRGGGFILSTGDQLGRDTPDENIFAMVNTAKTYGRYR